MPVLLSKERRLLSLYCSGVMDSVGILRVLELGEGWH